MQGWNVSQLGPALPDLQIITGSRLDEASYYFTALSVGFLCGASVSGWIFKKMNSMFVMAVINFIFAVITAVIPWSKFYAFMISLFLARGITQGIVDAGKSNV